MAASRWHGSQTIFTHRPARYHEPLNRVFIPAISSDCRHEPISVQAHDQVVPAGDATEPALHAGRHGARGQGRRSGPGDHTSRPPRLWSRPGPSVLRLAPAWDPPGMGCNDARKLRRSQPQASESGLRYLSGTVIVQRSRRIAGLTPAYSRATRYPAAGASLVIPLVLARPAPPGRSTAPPDLRDHTE